MPGGPDDPTPGAASIEAERFIEHYLDFLIPGLSGSVATMLDDLSAQRRPGAAYLSLPRSEREGIILELSDHESPEIRDLANLLVALAVAAVYGEWSGQDSEGRLVRRPLGWELTGFRGPRSGVRALMKD